MKFADNKTVMDKILNDQPENFPERLEYLLNLRKLTKKELGDKAGIPNNYLSTWIQKRIIPNAESLLKLAQALNVSPYYLLFGGEFIEQQTSVTFNKNYALLKADQQKFVNDFIEFLLKQNDTIK